MQTIKQIERGIEFNAEKLRARCGEIVAAIEKVLASPIFNVNFKLFAELECLRCNSMMRKRVPLGKDTFEVSCFECGAEYAVVDEGPGKSKWEPLQQEIGCPTTDCDATIFIWRDEARPGTCWKCHDCGEALIIAVAVIKNEIGNSDMAHPSGVGAK